MPETKVIFFMEEDGSVPVFDWLDKLSSKRARAKCLALLKLLALTGHELRRPERTLFGMVLESLELRWVMLITGCCIFSLGKTR